MDYSVRDSSIIPDPYSTSTYTSKDDSIRVGIVREERILQDKSTRYVVEVFMDGRQVPVSCVLMNRFGGIYNFEEYRVRPWGKIKSDLLPPGTADKYTYRSGDTVVVGFLNGNAREGVILGGLFAGKVVDYFTNAAGDKNWQNIWFTFAGYALLIAFAFLLVFRYKHDPKQFQEIKH